MAPALIGRYRETILAALIRKDEFGVRVSG
jgi:hypothetical protein